MRPVTASQDSCLKCHSGAKAGDTLGVMVSVALLPGPVATTAPRGSSRETLEEMALASEKVVRALEGKPTRKVIVVPDRIVNVVV